MEEIVMWPRCDAIVRRQNSISLQLINDKLHKFILPVKFPQLCTAPNKHLRPKECSCVWGKFQISDITSELFLAHQPEKQSSIFHSTIFLWGPIVIIAEDETVSCLYAVIKEKKYWYQVGAAEKLLWCGWAYQYRSVCRNKYFQVQARDLDSARSPDEFRKIGHCSA